MTNESIEDLRVEPI